MYSKKALNSSNPNKVNLVRILNLGRKSKGIALPIEPQTIITIDIRSCIEKMKAPLALNSIIEKATVVLAFLPLVFMIYPESVAAAYNAQNSGGQALVFEIDSKPTQNLTYDELLAYESKSDLNTFLAPKVKAYLESKGSPLAEYAEDIVKQPQWQRALAISYVESNFGKRCADNNCSGIGVSPSHKSWERFATKKDWFIRMTQLLERPIYKERYTTCNAMKGVYVVPGSARWVNGCNTVSNELLAITEQAKAERIAFLSIPTPKPVVTAATAEIALVK